MNISYIAKYTFKNFMPELLLGVSNTVNALTNGIKGIMLNFTNLVNIFNDVFIFSNVPISSIIEPTIINEKATIKPFRVLGLKYLFKLAITISIRLIEIVKNAIVM